MQIGSLNVSWLYFSCSFMFYSRMTKILLFPRLSLILYTTRGPIPHILHRVDLWASPCPVFDSMCS